MGGGNIGVTYLIFHSSFGSPSFTFLELWGVTRWPRGNHLAGRVVSNGRVAGTIDAAATGLGLPITHPDGQRLYGGHSMRVSEGPKPSVKPDVNRG